MTNLLENYLKMSKENVENTLYLKASIRVLISLIGQYVGDSFHAGTDIFKKAINVTAKKLTSMERLGKL